jgi:hypothetical protein
MATVERVESQVFRETTEGMTLTRLFTSTWTDYNVGTSIGRWNTPYPSLDINPFPFRVGDPLAFDTLSFPLVTNSTLNLRITEINIQPRDNENIIAEIFYSTVYDRVNKRKEPDTNASWEEQFDMSASVSSEDIYYVDSASAGVPYKDIAALGFKRNWKDDWENAGFDEDERPANETYTPTWVWTVRAYSSTLYFKRITDAFLSVNNSRWLQDYFGNIANRNGFNADANAASIHQIDGSDTNPIEDTGRWLFTACPYRRAEFSSWEYNFEFTYNVRWPWNAPYNITQRQYPVLDFATLFEGMTNEPSGQGQGGVRA